MESSQAEQHWPTFDIKSIIEILTNLGLESKLTPKDFKNPSVSSLTSPLNWSAFDIVTELYLC